METARVTSLGDFAEKSGFTAKIMSASKGYISLSRRNDSRIILFIRFLFTAPFI